MTEGWVTGWLAALTLFTLLLLGLGWVLFRWGQRQVDRIEHDAEKLRRMPP